MIIHAVFSHGYNDDYSPYETLVDVFSSPEKAQTYIDGVIHQRKLDCKLEQLSHTFSEKWYIDNPNPYDWVEQIRIKGMRPKYNSALSNDKEYNRLHAERVHEWRATIERPCKDRHYEWQKRKTIAVKEYLSTLDMEQQDLSDVDLEYYGKENNLFIRELTVK